MESEVEKKEGRGADLGMIASGSKKENTTMGLVGGKQVLNEERKEPKRKEGREADQMDLRFKRRKNDDGCNMDCHGGIYWIPQGIVVEWRKEE